MVQIATPSRERLDSYVRMREADRAPGRCAERPDYGRIGAAGRALPAPVAAARGAGRLLRGRRRDDGDAAAGRDEPGGQGVRRLPGRTAAACCCCPSSPAPQPNCAAAMLVNPYDTDGVKDGLRQALHDAGREARRRMRLLRRQVLAHDVDRWAQAFLSALEDTKDPVAAAVRRLPVEAVAAVAELCDTPKLLVGTDFDGTLAPFVDDPSQARAVPGSVEALRTAGRRFPVRRSPSSRAGRWTTCACCSAMSGRPD